MRNGSVDRSESPPSFSFSVAVGFTINYVVGTGFLTIPWAFSQTGCFLAIVTLATVTYFSISAALFILETMARAETIINSSSTISSEPSSNAVNALLLPPSDRPPTRDDSKLNRIGSHVFEMPELCQIFLGTTGRRVYTACISLYLYCALLAYSIVFSKACASNFDLGSSSYSIFLSIYAIIVLPLSCAELSEQIIVQLVLAAGRVLIFICMILTVVIAFNSPSSPFKAYPSISHQRFEEYKPHNWHFMLPILVFANIFHHSIPGLSGPVADKSQLGSIYTTTILICFIAYLMLGVTLSAYFGEDTPTSSNLLWASYSLPQLPSIVGALVSSFVVMFPAMDVTSCFPLCAITLGNNLMSSLCGDTARPADKKIISIFFRLLSAVPPILLAYFVDDLGAITRLSGICGFAITFVFPSLLAYQSEMLLHKRGLSAKTMYSSVFTLHVSILLILGLSVLFLIFFSVIAFL